MFNDTFMSDTGGDSDDDISITSTILSEHHSDDEYLVEEILADKWNDDKTAKLYLVKWEGYSIERSTWEPKENFQSWDLISQAYEKRIRENNIFDVEEWEMAKQRRDEEALERHRKRKEKRRRIKPNRRPTFRRKYERTPEPDLAGFVVDEVDESDEGSDSDDVPLARRRLRKLRNGKVVNPVSDDPTSSSSSGDEHSDSAEESKPERTSFRNRSEKRGQARIIKKTSPAPVRKHVPSKYTTINSLIPKKRPHAPSSSLRASKSRPNFPPKLAPSKSFTGLLDRQYNRLSIANNANKRGRTERAPDINQLSLIRPAEISIGRQPINAGVETGLNNLSISQSPKIQQGPMSAVLDSIIRKDTKIPPHTAPIPKKRAAGPDTWKQSATFPDVLSVQCKLVYGPKNRPMGMASFLGFSKEFIAMIKKLGNQVLWVSTSLENSYIQKIFVPEMGTPLEYADMDISMDDCESFVDALVILHGAGVVLNEHFTLMVFQPSNDTLRKAFKTQQQQLKTPLRVVAYPPLDLRQTNRSAQALLRQPLDTGFDDYVSNLLSNTARMRYDANESCACIIYCPELAGTEEIELQTYLEIRKNKIISLKEIQNQKYRTKGVKLQAFVHVSLKNKLHLLPSLKSLRDINAEFYFFGLDLDPAGKPFFRNGISKFWPLGAMICVTPLFVVQGGKAFDMMMKYQKSKAGSTKICCPSGLYDRVISSISAGGAIENASTAAIINNLHELKENEFFEIEILPNKYNEFETLVDEFVFFQQRHLYSYRRFILCHAFSEVPNDPYYPKLYNTVEFKNPDSAERFFAQGMGVAPAPKVPKAPGPGSEEGEILDPRIKTS